MDEEKWLTGRDPRLLYAHARKVARPTLKSGRRRLRLYACACCCLVWELLGTVSRAAVEAAEGFADGRVSLAEVRGARAAATAAWRDVSRHQAVDGLAPLPKDRQQAANLQSARPMAAYAAVLVTSSAITSDARQAAAYARQAHCSLAGGAKSTAVADRLLHCELLRDIFGNPYRPVQADPAWLHRNDGAVVKVARAIYDEQAFERLPLLADALEDSGCTDVGLLAHLRGPGPHVRGCWALDLLRDA